jgi:hypothetical protein
MSSLRTALRPYPHIHQVTGLNPVVFETRSMGLLGLRTWALGADRFAEAGATLHLAGQEGSDAKEETEVRPH